MRKKQSIPLRFRFVKKLPPGKIRSLMEIYSENGWTDENDSPSLYSKMLKNSFLYLVCEKDGEIIAAAKAMSDGANDAYIQDVAVRKEWRGKNIGGTMIREMKRALLAKGIKWIGLVSEKNAVNFYRKEGFRPMKSRTPMLYEPGRKSPR